MIPLQLLQRLMTLLIDMYLITASPIECIRQILNAISLFAKTKAVYLQFEYSALRKQVLLLLNLSHILVALLFTTRISSH